MQEAPRKLQHQPVTGWRRAVAITNAQASRDPAYSPGAGSDPVPGQGLFYSAGDPTERARL